MDKISLEYLAQVNDSYKHKILNVSQVDSGRNTRRLEKGDYVVFYIFENEEDLEREIFDKDILIINNKDNGTPNDKYFVEIIFNADNTFTLKRLSTFVKVKDITLPVEHLSKVNIFGKAIKVLRDL